MTRILDRTLGLFRTMAGRIFVILLIGILLSASVALALADGKRRADLERVRLERVADRTQFFVSLLDRADQSERDLLLTGGDPTTRGVSADFHGGAQDVAMSELLGSRLGSTARPVAYQASIDVCLAPRGGLPDSFRQPGDILRRVPPDGRRPVGLESGRPLPPDADRRFPLDGGRRLPPDLGIAPPLCWVATAFLSDGTPVTLAVGAPPQPTSDSRWLDPFYLGVLALAAAVLAFVVARMAARPWAGFARAATALGRNLHQPPLPVGGVTEVREMAQAFNSMQTDLKRHVADRTQMLAAITHDLQTPLTRIRLRLEKVQDEALRDRLIDDMMAMEDLIREGLDLASSTRGGEPRVVIDCASLLESIAEDAADAGRPVKLGAVVDADICAGPTSLRRCLENLIENAIAYGGSAEISSESSAREITAIVRDRGPGIPEDKLSAVFEPFVRLELSRSRETGGSGLGLAIAKRLAEQNAARLTLRNHPDGGLESRLAIPRASTTAASTRGSGGLGPVSSSSDRIA